MTQAGYQIVVLDWTGSPTKIYDTQAFYSMKYSRTLNGVGSIAIALPTVAGLSSIFKLDYFIEVQRTDPITGKLKVEETFLVRSIDRFRDGDDERLIIGGQSLNHLIKRRLVDPADDPGGLNGYSLKSGTAGAVMRGYAYDQMQNASAARAIPNFSINGDYDIGNSVGQRLRYDNLFKIFQTIAAQGQADFHIRRISGNTLRLDIQRFGIDRRKSTNYPGSAFTYLDTKRGNLRNPSLRFNRTDEQTFVYLNGQGISNHRYLVTRASDRAGDSPYNRIEYVEDHRVSTKRLVVTMKLMTTAAKASLAKKRQGKEFTFEPNGTEPGNVYHQDWDLGDYLTATWDDEELEFRVTKVEITVEQGGEKIDVEISQPDVV